MGSLTYELTLAGLAVGSAAALTGIGLIVTYRATGVLNLAQGAIAMVTAYVMRQLVVEWDWPPWWAAAASLLLFAPGLGLLLDRLVFRPLAAAGERGEGGGPAQTLVASLGVFVLLVGAAGLIWGPGARADAPALLPADPWVQLGTAVALAAAVGAVTWWTGLGRELRAVVDDRRLAALSGIDADRVGAGGWAFGAFTAGLTGVLLAPLVRLDPYGLPLLVMEVMAVAVAAALRSLPVAIAVALAVGVAQSQLTRLHPRGWAEPLVQAVGANLFVVALLIAALALPGVGGRGSVSWGAGLSPSRLRMDGDARAWIVCGVLFLLPLGFAGSDLHTSVQVPAIAVVLLSLSVVTGRGGQISLGQAAYAGLGALFTALLAAGRFPGLPALGELAALVVAVALVAPLGLLTGWPAIRRRGLALALATLAIGVAVSRFVFAQPYATSGLGLGRPPGFGHDRAYYVLELVLLSVALLCAATLRRGPYGRALAAMRDHEEGAAAAGVRVPALKLTAFVAGAALAALGGAMLGMGVRAFDAGDFDPVRGLLWFAAVVVLGADSLLGALAAAALLVGLDAGARGGVAAAVIGVLAVLLGRYPAGPQQALDAARRALTTHRRVALTPAGRRARARVQTALALAGTAPGGDSRRLPRLGGRFGSTAGPGGTRRTGGPPTGRRPDPAGPAGAPPASTRPGPSDTPDAPTAGRDARATSPGKAPTPDTPAAGPGEAPAPDARATGPVDSRGGRQAGGRGRREGYETRDSGAPAPPEPATRRAANRRAWRAGEAGAGRWAGEAGAGRWAGGRGRLTGRGLRVTYGGGFTALKGADITVAPGRVTALVGPNGAGKSTLFHCLCGTVRPDAGRVLLDGRDITRRPDHARTRLGLARTFQRLAVFPSLTVAENVLLGAEQGRVRDPAAAERVLRLLGLDGTVRDAPAAELPTGTLRRVELGRALAGGPRVLLLDEPAAGLDAVETAALARLLRSLAADGMALLVVEHDLELIGGLADVVYAMEAGRIVASGPAARVLARVRP
ncbi:branched-chain amino acid ABC transporter permease/ATP-binding protein [Streptomyces sp. SAJ15]|uniref:branched-chain amino acid ABC transporter permease/ATP-binding protein n=1 Tax=Streptomyces sp. SAJ15 TaxID=2011095 RepID=UPI0011868928|nr:branched-chain amino acid ABC transporter permease/ATP-binding protein [Streptomyces sp. SAJ15]TVL90620.1 ABC transporter [Streptomyces sp. SAJ15]